MSTIVTLFALFAIGVVAAPKELPRLSRIAGRFTGKGVKALAEFRQVLSQSKDSEVVKLRQELEGVVSQFNEIRYDVRQGFNFKQPVSAWQPPQMQQQPATQQQVQAQPVAPLDAIIPPAIQTPSIVSPLSNGFASRQAVTQPVQAVSLQTAQTSSTAAGAFAAAFAGNMAATLPQQPKQQQSFSQAFASLSSMSGNESVAAPGSDRRAVEEQLLRSQEEYQTKNAFKPFYFYDENAKEDWVDREIAKNRRVKLDPAKSPFAGVEFGHKPVRDLYEEGSESIRTEGLGSGADILSRAILERFYGQYVQKKGFDPLAQSQEGPKKQE